MGRDLKIVTKKKGMTTSELFRDLFRSYQSHEAHPVAYHRTITWDELQTRLKRVSRMGRKVDGAAFIAKDRLSH